MNIFKGYGKKRVGQWIAMLFFLSLFFDVACLPLFSNVAAQVEHSLVAETEISDAEVEFKFENFDGLLSLVTVFISQDLLEQPFRNEWLAAEHGQSPPSTPTFISIRSLRL